jgi:hypothetical protein
VDKLRDNDDLLSVFPSLKIYPEFRDDLKKDVGSLPNMNIVFRWIVLLYDPGSPYAKIDDFSRRKVIAAREAGFVKVKTRFRKDYANILSLSGPNKLHISAMIIAYCRIHRDESFRQISILQTVLERNNLKLLNGVIESKEEMEVLKIVQYTTEAINKERFNFLSGDLSDHMYQETLEMIENETLALTPEDIALKREARQAIDDVAPYGSRYSFDRYKEEDLDDSERERLENELTNNTDECRRHQDALGLPEIRSNGGR